MIYQIVLIAAVAALSAASGVVPVRRAPQPYQFGYNIKDKEGEQYRQEEGVGGEAVRGSYGFTDLRGVRRDVEYVADKAGFRAQVKTNEPGTANQNPAAVRMVSDAPNAGRVAVPHGVGYNNLANAVPAAGYGLGYGLGNGRRGYGLGYGRLGYGRLGYGRLGYGRLGYGTLGYDGYGRLGYGRLAYDGLGLGLGLGHGLGYDAYGFGGLGRAAGLGLGGLGLGYLS